MHSAPITPIPSLIAPQLRGDQVPRAMPNAARTVLVDVLLYCVILPTAYVVIMFTRDPLPRSEIPYFWFYYAYTFPVLFWGVVAIPAMLVFDRLAPVKRPTSRRVALVAFGAAIMALPAIYLFRDGPLTVLFAIGGAFYGWAFRSSVRGKSGSEHISD